MKALLKEKRAFVSGDKEELKSVQRELRRKIRQEKGGVPAAAEQHLWGLERTEDHQGAKVPACGRPGKFSGDSAAIGIITDGDNGEYRGLIQDFVDWSLLNHLQINASKTKVLVVDFCRRNNPPPVPVNILGMDVNVVKSFKYLGVHLNNNLDWTHSTDTLIMKGTRRLFLLRRLRKVNFELTIWETVDNKDCVSIQWDWKNQTMSSKKKDWIGLN
ncbi:hypothetical protein D4764_15G0009010 [Takifugu flavidus]|uniref:Alkylated DNA repair protein AlkB homologue 8 N-terminal domain-containing protein n=1 Tax=Takifugu flavidus TaxID=433684 RepID=A0A5C6P5R7_9TELE|nr:hypothetical protein D4764_15G0009010 [Takifugu flavidus]